MSGGLAALKPQLVTVYYTFIESHLRYADVI